MSTKRLNTSTTSQQRQQQHNQIPSRWLNCPRKSEIMLNKYIIFKTPLNSTYDEQIPIQNRFTPKMILDFIQIKQVKICVWIDLTNTSRFYQKLDIPNINYVKLKCRGHGESPTIEQTKEFINICRQYINENNTELIAIHCTHGFNRSGYLLCCLLIEEYDMSVSTALLCFKKHRPPGIYKQDYINKLYELYGDEHDIIIKVDDVLPEWCRVEEDVEQLNPIVEIPNHHHEQQQQQQHGNNKRFKTEFIKENPKFMDGIDNIELIDINTIKQIQKKVHWMCGWKGTGFPGSQPVSMDIKNIYKLNEKPYMVSWKADGTRYLLLINDYNQIYFIDRDNYVFKVNCITFVCRNNYNEYIKNTLVDGEMVIDTVDGIKTPRFLIYDIIQFDGKDYKEMDFRRRLGCIKDEIVLPRYDAIGRGIIKRAIEPFGVRLKDFWAIDNCEKILNGRFTLQLPHAPDGLIFQPENDPYECGRCDNVLKWKPPELNTIDFRLQIRQISGEGIVTTKVGELYVGQLNTPFGYIKPIPKSLLKYDGKIIECKYDGKSWVFERERTDKSFPNAYSTATAVAFSISNPVRKDNLLDFILKHSYKK